jgi:hypothetical protein
VSVSSSVVPVVGDLISSFERKFRVSDERLDLFGTTFSMTNGTRFVYKGCPGPRKLDGYPDFGLGNKNNRRFYGLE